MCKVISVISCKGGVGKTTSAVNISSYIQMQGKRVCVIDLDPQHNLSKHFGVFPGHLKNRPTIYDLIHEAINYTDEESMSKMVNQSIIKTSTVDVIPAVFKLNDSETELTVSLDREHQLEYVISFLKKSYDFIFIDCHTGLDLLTLNAMVASNSVLIPVEAHVFSADGLNQVVKMVDVVKRRLNSEIYIEGMIITKYQQNTNCCRSIFEFVDKEFGSTIKIFKDKIKYAIKLADVPAFGISIHEYAPKSEVAISYANIAKEVLRNA